MSGTAILSRPVEVARIPSDGLEVDIVANDEELTALAAAYDLVAVKGLRATAALRRDDKGEVTVDGRTAADVVQSCVVSLAPVDQHIEEPFSVRFVAPGSPDAPGPARPGAEVVVDPALPEPPEILTGATIDVGALAEEHFVLAIDPYPRAPGAVLSADQAQEIRGDADTPFAPLKGLVKTPPPKP
ncbi:MAG: DUF177 domain-containing protein [Bauldia sp.]